MQILVNNPFWTSFGLTSEKCLEKGKIVIEVISEAGFI
jgi:hypothetical protein